MRFYCLAFLIFLSGCSSYTTKKEEICDVVDLNESTTIILDLIAKNSLAHVLEESEPVAIKRLIKNFSPAMLALEAEVLSWEQPVILFFIDKNHAEHHTMNNIFKSFACKHKNNIKFVKVDTEELFKIAEQFEFTNVPALCLMYNREELCSVEGINLANIESNLQQFIDNR